MKFRNLLHPKITVAKRKKKSRFNWKVKLSALLISLGLVSLGIYSATVAINNWFDAHYFQFNKVLTMKWQWPIEVKAREPEVDVVEIVVPVPEEAEDNTIILKVSHYWPALGGTNCATFVDGECVSKMANGESWQEYAGVAIACPRELEFGTKIKVMDRVWTCMDRGGAIVKDGDAYWIDMLLPTALVDYGSVVVGEIVEEVN